MSSPRLVASLVAVSAAGLLVVSCGDQFSPTVPSSPTGHATVAASATELNDMLADPAVPNFSVRDTTPPVVYPPNAPPSPWPPGPPPMAAPGVAVPDAPTTSPLMHVQI